MEEKPVKLETNTEQYTVINEVFALSTAKNNIFEISCRLTYLLDLREEIELERGKEEKDEDWDFTDDDFPLKILEADINGDWITFRTSTIFNEN